MNKRLKELATQATTVERDGFQYFDKKKFAELIVRECANLLMKPEYVMNHPEELTDYNRGWVNGRLLGIEHIEGYFGVEE